MADGMPGMPWKEALKRLKEYHQAGADGSPASMQKELEGLEESLKGWETRDERRDRTLEIYRQNDEKLRKENTELQKRVNDLEKDAAELAKLSTCICSEDAGGLMVPFDPACPQHSKCPGCQAMRAALQGFFNQHDPRLPQYEKISKALDVVMGVLYPR